MDTELNALFNFEMKPPPQKKAHAFFLKRAYSLQFVSSEIAPLKSIPYEQKAELQHRASGQGAGFCLLREMLQAVLFITWKRARRAFGRKQNCKRLNCITRNHGRVITVFLAT